MANEADGPAEPTAKGRTNALIVSSRQKGNPLLKSLRSVPWEFGDIEPDYIVGQTTCALYLSLRYHQLFPNYIHGRLRSLGRAFDLRLLLVLVDVVSLFFRACLVNISISVILVRASVGEALRHSLI